ncbi:MAG TPA: flagellar filament capping protein FliD [Spirochaetota bacterium]|mgnify:FL=1|nr:flagellar filament capping protein FliD [Spirochaetota bacterium]
MAIPMPGLAVQGLDINKTIEKLVTVKREPLKRMESEIEELNLQKDIWAALRQRLVTLGNLAKRMYDYTNPFGVLIAESGDKESFTATAERKAKKGQRRVQVMQIASAHRIASDSIKKEQKLPGGIFYIEMGSKKVRVDFSSGGTLADLSSRIEVAGREVVRPSLTHDTTETSILVLDAVKGGTGNVLRFSGDVRILKEAGLLTEGRAEEMRVPLDGPSSWTTLSPAGAVWSVRDGMAALAPGARIEYGLPRAVTAAAGWTFGFSLMFETNSRPRTNQTAVGQTVRTNILIGPDDPLKIEDLTIFGPRLVAGIPVDKTNRAVTNAPARAAGTNSSAVVRLVEGGDVRTETAVPAAFRHGVWQDISLPLTQLANVQAPARVLLVNENTAARVTVKDMVFRLSKDGGLVAKNELVAPRDAIVSIDGVRITRPDNAISDAIEGVALRLIKPGKETMLDIRHDVDLVSKYILELVEGYNQTLLYMNAVTKNLTREERQKLESDQKNKTDLMKALEDKDKADEEKHKGRLPGDMTISQLKSSLGVIMMSPYKTRLERELTLLMQIGISTGKIGATWADLKNSAGMLELDTSVLKSMIEKDILAVAQIFGNDLNGDFVVDHGACFRLYELTRIWTQPGNSGVIAVKVRSLDRVIVEKRKSIDRVEMSIKAYEDRLRAQFGSMETRVREYQERGRWLNRQGQ